MAPSLSTQRAKEPWRKELAKITLPPSGPRRKSRTKQLAIISIDFGTTFSTVAHACGLDPELYDRDDLILAPSLVEGQHQFQDGNTWKKREEVPSVLAYDSETGQAYFGLEVQAALERHKIQQIDVLDHLKLIIARRSLVSTPTQSYLSELDRKIHRVRRRDPITGLRATCRPSIEELISDCLRSLWQNAIWNLTKIHTQDSVKSWDIRLILCIPAIWEVNEENIMKKAAELGGLPTPVFVFEPEGAGHLYFAETRELMDINDIFVICDAGGGTVDCITYLPSQIEPLHVQEFVTGSGAACGSCNLNKDFRALLPTLLSDVLAQILMDMDREEEEFYDMVTLAFEEKKKEFNGFGFGDGKIYLEIPGIKRREARNVSLHKDQMVLKKETVLKIFEKTTRQVHELVRDQIEESHKEIKRNAAQLDISQARVKYIVLVGGFGGSPHLQVSLEKEFFKDEIMGYPIPLVFPNSPASAIARGAILRETNKSFVSIRRSRLSFGFVQHDPYDRKLHKNCKPRFDEHDNMKYAYNRIHWLIQRNEPIPRKGFVRIWDSRRTLPIDDQEDFEIHQALYGCRTYVEDGTSLNGPKGKKNIFQLGMLKADMSTCPDWWGFPRRPAEYGDGSRECLEFEYRLRLTVDESTMVWEMLIPPKGILPESESETLNDSEWFSKKVELINIDSYVN